MNLEEENKLPSWGQLMDLDSHHQSKNKKKWKEFISQPRRLLPSPMELPPATPIPDDGDQAGKKKEARGMIGSEETRSNKDTSSPTNKTVDRLRLKMATHHPLMRNKHSSQPALTTFLNRTMPSITNINISSNNNASDSSMMVTSRSTPDLRVLAEMQAKNQHRKSIQGLTLSEAKEKLFTHKHSGVVTKRGFGGWRRWVDRFLLLRGRVLTYYTVDERTGGIGTIRGQLELTKFTRIKVCDFGSSRNWGFEICPQDSKKHGDAFRISGHREDEKEGETVRGASSYAGRRCQSSPWQLSVQTRVQREQWILALIRSVRLIERVEEPAKLRGLGSVFDHFKVGKILGKGRFGVVRECTSSLSLSLSLQISRKVCAENYQQN